MLDKLLGIDHLPATHDLCQIGIEAGTTQTHSSCGDRRDHHTGCSGCNFPKRGGAGFLDFGVRRKILERQHIIGRQADDLLGRERAGYLAQRTHHRQQFVQRAVVGDSDDERPCSSTMQQGVEQGFGGGSEPGQADPPRAALDPGNSTREGGRLFHVRKEFADERQDHRLSILAAVKQGRGHPVAVEED